MQHHKQSVVAESMRYNSAAVDPGTQPGWCWCLLDNNRCVKKHKRSLSCLTFHIMLGLLYPQMLPPSSWPPNSSGGSPGVASSQHREWQVPLDSGSCSSTQGNPGMC